MGRLSRRKLLVGLGLAATGLGLGCGGANPFIVIPTLINGGESKIPAEYPLKVPPKKSEAKVVVLVYSKMGLPVDLTGVDRMLNAELVRVLKTRIKENEQKVLVLETQVLDKYKTDNPNWRTVKPYDLGKEFNADYLIDVEIEEMDLYKPGSRGQWLQGHARIGVGAYDLAKPATQPAYTQDFSLESPGQETEKLSPAHLSAFRLRFVQRIASEIAAKFSDTTPQVGRMSDER